jgi:DNA-binding MarR family transcriptional regulator
MPSLNQIALEIQKDCLCTRVRETSRLVSRLFDEGLRPTGLQASQLPLLVAVTRFGERGARMSALADVLGMDRTTLTRNVGPLEKQGLLRVARAPADARVRVVLLSPAGERALARAYPIWQRAQQRLRQLLGADQVADLQVGLSRVSQALRTRENRR